jgi:4-alpha-glucanotransferase
LLAINQEDLTKELSQQNLPGTTWQYPNWGRKMRFSLEQLRVTPMFRLANPAARTRLHRHVPQLEGFCISTFSGRKNEPNRGPE